MRFYGTGHGVTFQIAAAYSAIVRSVENFPELATFKMAFLAQAFWSPYKSSNLWSTSRYDFKSAKCMERSPFANNVPWSAEKTPGS